MQFKYSRATFMHASVLWHLMQPIETNEMILVYFHDSVSMGTIKVPTGVLLQAMLKKLGFPCWFFCRLWLVADHSLYGVNSEWFGCEPCVGSSTHHNHMLIAIVMYSVSEPCANYYCNIFSYFDGDM
jgi:hypothetical protein